MPWLRSLPFLVLLALAGCASAPRVLDNRPPEHLLIETPHPVIDTKTNGGLARAIQAYRKALISANDDKAAIREHYKEK